MEAVLEVDEPHTYIELMKKTHRGIHIHDPECRMNSYKLQDERWADLESKEKYLSFRFLLHTGESKKEWDYEKRISIQESYI